MRCLCFDGPRYPVTLLCDTCRHYRSVDIIALGMQLCILNAVSIPHLCNAVGNFIDVSEGELVNDSRDTSRIFLETRSYTGGTRRPFAERRGGGACSLSTLLLGIFVKKR